jgi:hypothetical protein
MNAGALTLVDHVHAETHAEPPIKPGMGAELTEDSLSDTLSIHESDATVALGTTTGQAEARQQRGEDHAGRRSPRSGHVNLDHQSENRDARGRAQGWHAAGLRLKDDLQALAAARAVQPACVEQLTP